MSDHSASTTCRSSSFMTAFLNPSPFKSSSSSYPFPSSVSPHSPLCSFLRSPPCGGNKDLGRNNHATLCNTHHCQVSPVLAIFSVDSWGGGKPNFFVEEFSRLRLKQGLVVNFPRFNALPPNREVGIVDMVEGWGTVKVHCHCGSQITALELPAGEVPTTNGVGSQSCLC